ncbi:MAG: phosphoribosylformylglycinamidine synthase [Planctomyces sp.]|nr:phosphoribosylformylglycinamidine synthase [Planctomyces sp.]
MRPRALVLRAAGTNCDSEMCHAFDLAGAQPDLVHLDAALQRPDLLADYHLIGFPGGFSYGDDVASGRIFAMRLRQRLYPALRQAARRGVPMIGACNGFQVLVQAGLLPGPAPGQDWPADHAPAQRLSLTSNAGGRFIDRWCRVEVDPATPCVWTRGLEPWVGRPGAADALMLPVAHGEGRLVTASPEEAATLRAMGKVALRYAAGENPNGSEDDAAGICDASGLIFGLMPHPERFTDWSRHPFWTALPPGQRLGEAPGLAMFRGAVSHARRALTQPHAAHSPATAPA